MRVATLSRTELGQRHMRFDPAFYVRRALVRSTINSEGSRHVRLNDLVDSIHDGARLPLTSSGVPMIRLNNVRPCELDLSGVAHADGTAAKWINVCEGDVLFTRAAQPFRAAVGSAGRRWAAQAMGPADRRGGGAAGIPVRVTVHGFGSALSKAQAGGEPGSGDCWATAGLRLLFGFETPA